MDNKKNKKVTIGIPAYKAQDYIVDAISSISTQTFRDNIQVIIAPDLPGESYSFLKRRFPNLDIKILKCEKNTGPGLARQRIIDACNTDWLMFMDSDDLLFSPIVVERMYEKALENSDCVEIICPFFEEAMKPELKGRFIKKDDPWNPWVFSRLFSVGFIKANDICFSDLRAGEDCEFNWKIQLLIDENEKFNVYILDEIAYLWRKGSDNSLTRQNINSFGIPQFNYDLGSWGLSESTLRVIKFLKSKNKAPTKNYILAAIAAVAKLYVSYTLSQVVEPKIMAQHLWCAKRFYHEFYHEIDEAIPNETIMNMVNKGSKELYDSIKNVLGEDKIVPLDTFLEKMRTEPYGGFKEFWEIRETLPEDIVETDKKSKLIECVPREDEEDE